MTSDEKLRIDTGSASLSRHNNVVGRASESESAGPSARTFGYLFDSYQANAEYGVRNGTYSPYALRVDCYSRCITREAGCDYCLWRVIGRHATVDSIGGLD